MDAEEELVVVALTEVGIENEEELVVLAAMVGMPVAIPRQLQMLVTVTSNCPLQFPP